MNLDISTTEIVFIHCHCATPWKWENNPRTQLMRSMLVTKITELRERKKLHCIHHEILKQIVTIMCKHGFYTFVPDSVFQTAGAASVTLSLFLFWSLQNCQYSSISYCFLQYFWSLFFVLDDLLWKGLWQKHKTQREKRTVFNCRPSAAYILQTLMHLVHSRVQVEAGIGNKQKAHLCCSKQSLIIFYLYSHLSCATSRDLLARLIAGFCVMA